MLGGKKIVPERIRDNRAPYIAALRAADAAWDKGQIDVTQMAAYLEALVLEQVTDL